jgi:hypothetical protein
MEKKFVGKKAEPTIEELEFIYSHLKKLSDDEVLEEMQDTEFPVRSKGFIKRRRREFNAAKKVLETDLKKELDPIIIKRREQHNDELAGIANSFLEGDLTTIPYDATDEDQEYELDTGEGLTRKELIARLSNNIFRACDKYERYRVMDWLATHLESEYLSGKDLFAFIEARPVEFINIIRTLSARKTFKGTCIVCKDWR